MLNTIIHGDCLRVMKDIPDSFIDLTVTSPPYDNLRTYNGFVFDFEGIAQELYRVTKPGGVVVWVVGDATIKGSETGTSFRQALYFKEIGFNLHDTMIYEKENPMPLSHNRYEQHFEYMFIFGRNKPRSFNPILRTNKDFGKRKGGTFRHEGKSTQAKHLNNTTKRTSIKGNIWSYSVGKGGSTSDQVAFVHPAIFPEQLAEDHIISWSNPGDIVLDPMCGSGTTCKMAVKTDRQYIGIDISEEYCEIARKRTSDN